MSKPIYLYIAPFFPSPKQWRGGYLYDAVKALRADGRYEVVVMTSAWYQKEYEIDGIKVYKIPRKEIGSAEYLEGLLVNKNNKLFLNKVHDIGIDILDIAVCHVHDFMHYVQYALSMKKLNPKCLTLVHHHYAGFYDLRIGKLGKMPIWSDLLYLKLRREFEMVDAHVFISEHCRRCYCKSVDFDTGEDKGPLRKQLLFGAMLPDVKLPDSYVWYNGVDKSTFRPSGYSRRSHPFTIGCVGNYNPCKCQLDLIKAFQIVLRDMPDARLKLVGNGKTYAECVKYVTENGFAGSVDFMPALSYEKMPDFYRSIDLLVTPSVNEGFCCVNAESNYCGTPFLAIKGLPVEEILDAAEYDRWLVAPHDIDGMAKKIVEFARNPQRQRLSIDLDVNNLARQFVDWTIEKSHCLA